MRNRNGSSYHFTLDKSIKRRYLMFIARDYISGSYMQQEMRAAFAAVLDRVEELHRKAHGSDVAKQKEAVESAKAKEGSIVRNLTVVNNEGAAIAKGDVFSGELNG